MKRTLTWTRRVLSWIFGCWLRAAIWILGSWVLCLLYLIFGGKDDSTCWHVSQRTDGDEVW